VELRDFLEELDVDVVGIQQLREPAAGTESKNQHQSLVDRHFNGFALESISQASSIASADRIAARINLESLEQVEVDCQVQAPMAGIGEGLFDVFARETREIAALQQ